MRFSVILLVFRCAERGPFFLVRALQLCNSRCKADSAVDSVRFCRVVSKKTKDRDTESAREGERERERGDRVVRTANMDAMGVMSIGKQAVALSSGICGTPLKQSVVPVATKSGGVSFAVRAAGYDEELVKTAVCVFVLLLPACVRACVRACLAVIGCFWRVYSFSLALMPY